MVVERPSLDIRHIGRSGLARDFVARLRRMARRHLSLVALEKVHHDFKHPIEAMKGVVGLLFLSNAIGGLE